MDFLAPLKIAELNSGVSTGTAHGERIESHSPVDGKLIAAVQAADKSDYEAVIAKAQAAFPEWRTWPAPKRGEIVRQIGDALRANKEPLGKLVSYEMGKSLQEGYGEVQEMIDICDFAVGLSRQLYGLSMHSERPAHRMYEQWHPLGIVGIISAFNFPVAVWSWNSMLAWICGSFSAAVISVFSRLTTAPGVPAGATTAAINGKAAATVKVRPEAIAACMGLAL